MLVLRKRFRLLALLAVATLAVTACKGSSSTSIPPGGFPPVNPAGDHAQFVMAADAGATCTGTPAVLTFSLGSTATMASGNLAPSKNLTGASTKLSHPYSPFVDNNGNVWVANDNGTPSVTKYSVTATGNSAPTTNINGAATTFSDPSGVYVGESNGVNTYVYVTDYANAAIDIFPASANGNVAPSWVIKGAATLLSTPWGITLDSRGNIWVADWNAAAVYEFSNPTGASPGTYNEAPSETITGVATTLAGPSDVFFDSFGNLWVSDDAAGSIDEFAGAVDAAPAKRITGLGASTVTGLAVDSGGNVYQVGYSTYINIWTANAIPPGTASTAPTYTIAGASTKLNCATSVQVFSTSGTNDV